MSAELRHQLIEYQSTLPTNTALEKRKSIRLGREADDKLINTILRTQQNLQPGQALIMQVALAEKDVNYKKLVGYARVIHDAPIDLLDYLISKEIISHTERESGSVPSMMEMVVPPNIESKKFIRRTIMNTTHLCLFPKGVDGLVQILMHPSVIRGIKVDDISLNTENEPQIIFRAVNKP